MTSAQYFQAGAYTNTPDARADVLDRRVAFLFGLTSVTQVQLVGYLSIVEVAFLLLTPYYLVTRWQSIWYSELRTFLLLFMAWGAGAIITDIVRETAARDAMRGSTVPLLWINTLICLYLLFRRTPGAITPFIIGASFSGVIALYVFQPGTLATLAEMGDGSVAELHFRSLAGIWATFVAAGALLLRGRPRWVPFLFACFGLYCLMAGSRSTGGLYLVVAALLAAGIGTRVAGGPLAHYPLLRTAALMTTVGAASWMLAEVYALVVLHGLLGDDQLERFLLQSDTKVGILGGRAEFASALFAIADSPLIGHGSWALDFAGYAEKGAALLGAPPPPYTGEPRLIPGHSHLWGPWINHGILGFLCWGYVLFYVLRFFTRDLPWIGSYVPYAYCLCLTAVWHILFSPVGFRPLEGAGYAFMIACADTLRQQARAVAPQGWRART